MESEMLNVESKNADFKMRMTEPCEIMREMCIFLCDLAWLSYSHFKFCIAHLAFNI